MRAEAQVLAHIHPESAWLSCTLVSIYGSIRVSHRYFGAFRDFS